MNPSREVLASPSRYSGQISWDYDRAEIIADGAVHAIGVCLGLIGAVTIVVIAVKTRHQSSAGQTRHCIRGFSLPSAVSFYRSKFSRLPSRRGTQ
jgi:predicted membrane channel-forming protein YqfA (hemolysin III family)